MAEGDQYRCDWCNYGWRTKSDLDPIRCPSCASENITNEFEGYKDLLGKENIIHLDKKEVEKKPEVLEEEVEDSFLDKVSKIFKKK